MKITKKINKEIFREYDIRGIVPKDIDEDVSYTIGLYFGSKIRDLGYDKCLIGHDNRLSSKKIYKALTKGIMNSGVNIISLGLCTTPMYYYAGIKLNIASGIMITASHNPKEYNGFKMSFNALNTSGNAKGNEIYDFYDYIQNKDYKTGKGKIKKYSIKNEYIDLFKTSLSFGKKKVKVVIDPGNGTTCIIAKKLYNNFPIELISIFDKSDGNFPNHHPDPLIKENLLALREKVLKEKADVGLAFDGDGDRLGIVSGKGNFVSIDLYLAIMIKDIFDKVDNKKFLYDVKCSKAVADVILDLGGECECYRTGNSYNRARVYELNLPLGGELSGHVFFNDRFPGFDSGLYAGLRLLELLSKTDKTLDQLIDSLPKYYASEEIKIESSDNKKFEVIEKIKDYIKKSKYDYNFIDGVKIIDKDSWALVRASNTGPNITLRFEAKTEEKLNEIQDKFIKLVNEYNENVNKKR